MERSEKSKALSIGSLCIATYLVNYYLRHVLSVLTPGMIETGLFTTEYIGFLSSTYMVLYAVGQLINGFLGDFLSPKKLACLGIFLAGVASIAFPFTSSWFLHIACFAVLGFALSMVRGPLMKIISENTKPNYARVICVFFSCASFAGPLIASLLAIINNWRLVFIIAGGIAIVVSVIAYLMLSFKEKNAEITYKQGKWHGISSLFEVFKIEKFVFYMVIACIVEISTISISFWIPTFLTDRLQFEKNTANLIFTAISVVRSVMPFVALFLYRITNGKDVFLLKITFSCSALLFLSLLIAPKGMASALILALSLMAISCSSAILWSIYIPGLGKTGKVSSVNGVLDCVGYVAAAIANLTFSSFLGGIGWDMVIVLWSLISIAGVASAFLSKVKGNNKNEVS